MSLSFCKRLVVVKEREEILKGRAMANKAISAKIHYEIQKHESCEKTGRLSIKGLEGARASHWTRGHLDHRHFR